MFLLYTLATIYLLTFLACMYVLIFTIKYGTKNSYMFSKRIDYVFWTFITFCPMLNAVALSIVWKDYFNFRPFTTISNFFGAKIKEYPTEQLFHGKYKSN